LCSQHMTRHWSGAPPPCHTAYNLAVPKVNLE
jgi:hypothetical protein